MKSTYGPESKHHHRSHYRNTRLLCHGPKVHHRLLEHHRKEAQWTFLALQSADGGGGGKPTETSPGRSRFVDGSMHCMSAKRALKPAKMANSSNCVHVEPTVVELSTEITLDWWLTRIPHMQFGKISACSATRHRLITHQWIMLDGRLEIKTKLLSNSSRNCPEKQSTDHLPGLSFNIRKDFRMKTPRDGLK